jgi:Fungal specific transcription factor domain
MPVSLTQRVFEARYPDDESNDPGRWAILNLVFVGAHRFRAMRTVDSQSGDSHAWGYLQNAMAVLTELIMMNRDLVAVQAILGMAIALRASPNSRPCSVLLSTAVKIAQSINLHRRDQGTGLSATEIEQRKRVFWLAYIYDKDMSLQTRGN